MGDKLSLSSLQNLFKSVCKSKIVQSIMYFDGYDKSLLNVPNYSNNADVRNQHMPLAIRHLKYAYDQYNKGFDVKNPSEEDIKLAKIVAETVAWDMEDGIGSYSQASYLLFDEMAKTPECEGMDRLEFKKFARICKQLCDKEGMEFERGALPSYFPRVDKLDDDGPSNEIVIA